MTDVTTLLKSTQAGTPDAANKLFELLYSDLRSLAHAQVRRSGVHSPLNTTTLLHESYLRFLQSGELKAEDRRHFLAYATHVMRSIVVDQARAQLAVKRGAGSVPRTLDTEIASSALASSEDVIKVHDAIEEIAALDPRLAKVVELRYFGGLTEDEIASALEISPRTVQRSWEKARLVLAASLQGEL